MSFDLKLPACPKCQAPVPKEGKKFRVEVMVGRKRITKVVNRSIRDARDIEAKLKSDLLTGEYFKNTKNHYTLDEVYSQYINSSTAAGIKSVRIIKCYYEKHIQEIFGRHQIQNITPGQLEQFKTGLLTAKYAPKTVKNVVDIISVLFNYAHRYLDFGGDNPCERVERMKINNMVINIVPVEAYRAFLTFLDTWPDQIDRNLFKFLAYTGIRIGEALKICWEDFNADYGIIRLKDPKGGKDQSLPLNDLARAVLDAHRGIGAGPTIFGYTYKQANHHFRRIKKAAGLPDNFRIHDIRHQFATMLLNAGESITDVQKAMTHKDPKTTERYAHYLAQTLQKTVNKLDDILKK